MVCRKLFVRRDITNYPTAILDLEYLNVKNSGFAMIAMIVQTNVQYNTASLAC